jgi:NTP pyrophosphatase (non-canonical NTP hydrolase)
MSTIHEEHSKMVKDLMKSGSIMKNEWTNDDKERLRAVSLLGKLAQKLHSEVNKRFFPVGIDSDYELYHMTYAFCGEVGELSDALKKSVIYRKELDSANVLEEFGDLSFYIQGVVNVYNANLNRYVTLSININKLASQLMNTLSLFSITLEQAKEQNMLKLLKGDVARYKEGKYSDDQAKQRADKNFIDMEFNISGEIFKVAFFPDVPKVCWPQTMELVDKFEAACGQTFDQELLVQMAQSKIAKEKGE